MKDGLEGRAVTCTGEKGMTYIIIHVIWLVIKAVLAYDFTCPHHGQWNLIAETKTCPRKDYVCLLDDVELKDAEDCKSGGPRIENNGYKAVLNIGNLNTKVCSSTSFQPFQFSSLRNSKCVFEKSLCSEEGQVIADNGTSETDRSCRCDYCRGYALTNNTIPPCMPSKEDCTCYLKTCSVNEVLSPDYDCINKTDSHGYFQCSSFRPGTESTVPVTDIVPVKESDRVSLSYKKGNRSIDSCYIILVVVVVVVIIIVFIILYVCYWEQTDRKIGQCWKALKKVIICQPPEDQKRIIVKYEDKSKVSQEDIPGILVRKDEDSSSDYKDLKGKYTTCYSPEDLKNAIKQSLADYSKQHAVEERLKQYCNFHGMEFLGRTPGNGNCFFEAISTQIERLQLPRKSAENLRQEVTTYLKENPTYEANGKLVNLKDFVELEDLMKYCESMSKNNVWVDHVIVVTTARMLEQNIIIVTSSPETDKDDSLVWVDGGDGCNEKPPLLVGHYWEHHYQSLQPKGIFKQFEVKRCVEVDSVTFVHEVNVENIPGRSMNDERELMSTEPRTMTSDGGIQELVPHSGDSGNNSCHIKDKDSSSDLTVKEVSILKHLEKRQLHIEGEKVTFTCEVNSEVLHGKWLKDREQLFCSENLDITANGRFHEIVIHKVTYDDRGYYSFKIDNKSSGGLLVVLDLTPDKINYIRLCHLLKTVAVPVVREIFDREIQPNQLKKLLNKSSNKIYHLKLHNHINKREYDLLYPRVVEYSVKFTIEKYDCERILQNQDEELKLRAEIECAVSDLYINVEGDHKVTVVAFESGSIIVVLQLKSSADENNLKKILKTAVDKGNIGSFETASTGFDFTKVGNVPATSKDFDIRLMMVLMKNLIEFKIADLDVLPHQDDLTEEADLSRIKFIRKKIIQNSDRSITDEDLDNDWKHLSEAVQRLGGHAYKKKCEELKNIKPTLQHVQEYFDSENLLENQGQTSTDSIKELFPENEVNNLLARNAVRQIFDKQFPPRKLETEIEDQRKELEVLRDQKKITQSQWEDLFPTDKESLSSSRFDIKVMIILLRSTSFKDKDVFKTIENLQNHLSRPEYDDRAIKKAIKEINEAA